MNKVKDQEVLGREGGQSLTANLFKKLQETRVLNLATKGHRHLVIVSARKVWFGLALPDALLKHPIDALPRPFHQAALLQYFSDSAIPRRLTVENIGLVDSRRKASWADELDPPRILPDKYRPRQTIVAVTYRIENSFANDAFIEGANIPDEEPLTILLEVVAEINRCPKFVQK